MRTKADLSIDDALRSDAFFDDPYPTYTRLRDDDPVHWVEQTDSWLITRYDDVARLFPGSFAPVELRLSGKLFPPTRPGDRSARAGARGSRRRGECPDEPTACSCASPQGAPGGVHSRENSRAARDHRKDGRFASRTSGARELVRFHGCAGAPRSRACACPADRRRRGRLRADAEVVDQLLALHVAARSCRRADR